LRPDMWGQGNLPHHILITGRRSAAFTMPIQGFTTQQGVIFQHPIKRPALGKSIEPRNKPQHTNQPPSTMAGITRPTVRQQSYVGWALPTTAHITGPSTPEYA